jgi:hypothetical protein
MTIEFNTAYGNTPQWLLNYISGGIIALRNLNKHISRAEILLRQDNRYLRSENMVCQIRLTIFGGNLVVHTRSNSFEQSAKNSIRELEKITRQSSRLSDIEYSTVRV